VDDCESEGWECGDINGVSCGECKPEYQCEQGTCTCVPDCDGSHCGDDGCGDVCTCTEGATCDGKGTCIRCQKTCDELG
jgi:hypothetical protein